LDEHILPCIVLNVACMSSAKCEVSCLQQRPCCEADAQSTEPSGFWQCSCTAKRTFISWVIKNQISNTTFSIFKSVGNVIKENRIYQHLQKFCRKIACRIKAIRANLGKFGQNILCASICLDCSVTLRFTCYCVGTRNWQNINLFGDINDLTKDDYKNAAYFNLQVRCVYAQIGVLFSCADALYMKYSICLKRSSRDVRACMRFLFFRGKM